MDTILYLYATYQAQTNDTPLRFLQYGNCKVLRLGINLSCADLPRVIAQEDAPADSENSQTRHNARSRFPFSKLMMKAKMQKRVNTINHLRYEWFQKRIDPIVSQLCETLSPLDMPLTIYDEAVSAWLRADERSRLWRSLWPYGTFYGYREPQYADLLLRETHCAHYLVLGYDPDLFTLLQPYLRRMKSLRFVLDYYPNDLDDQIDTLYEEFGLTASARVLPASDDDHPYRSERIDCPLPSIVLDYSNETIFRGLSIAEGSVWIDMDAMDDKCRRMNEYHDNLTYLSLKKLWRGI
ncbi:MAG: hypothetical protein LBM60_03495 [Clostridium sp.]|jgi:hypothetical protein|nr:hypothetical protein [Clostridium sp.]